MGCLHVLSYLLICYTMRTASIILLTHSGYTIVASVLLVGGGLNFWPARRSCHAVMHGRNTS